MRQSQDVSSIQNTPLRLVAYQERKTLCGERLHPERRDPEEVPGARRDLRSGESLLHGRFRGSAQRRIPFDGGPERDGGTRNDPCRSRPRNAATRLSRSGFSWALLGFANVYYGLAERTVDLIVESLKKKTSLAVSRSMAHHPEIQHGVAEMVTELESIGPHVEKIAQDWSEGVDHGDSWPAKILAAKYQRGGRRLAHRRCRPRSLRRVWNVQEERAGTAVPRRPGRPLPSGELGADPRAAGEDGACHQPRRRASLGLEDKSGSSPAS